MLNRSASHAFLACAALLFVVCLTPAVQAADLDLTSFGAVADDGEDDGPALQAALDRIAASGGGRIIFPDGETDILSPVTENFLKRASSITLTGSNSGTRVRIAVGGEASGITLANLESVVVERLAFQGTPTQNPQDPLFLDAANALQFMSCLRAVVRDCDFYGLASAAPAGSVVNAIDTDLSVEDSSFRGCLTSYYAQGGGVVHSDVWRGLTVRRVDFLDYGTLNGLYFSKTTGFVGAWVYTGAPQPLVSANGQRRIVVEDVRMDEGADKGLHVAGGAEFVSVKGLNANVNETGTGVGIWLEGVVRGRIEQSWFGYAKSDHPAVQLSDCDIIELDSVKFSDGVSHIWTIQDTAWLILRHCEIPTDARYPDGVLNEGDTRVEVDGQVHANAVSLGAASYDARVGDKSVTVSVKRAGDASAAASFDYRATAGTAVAGADFVPVHGALRFAPGERQTSFSVPLLKGARGAADKTVNLLIDNPTDGAQLGAPRAAVLTIHDQDVGLGFNQTTYTVDETAGSALVTVTRAGDTSAAVSVRYETGGGTASDREDYTPAQGLLRFAPGVTEQSFAVQITNDAFAEGPETVGLTLSEPTGGATLGRSTATLVIASDDKQQGQPPANPADSPEFFVRQHYADFLNRAPDAAGLRFWTAELSDCATEECRAVKRINVSAAFFLSVEFQGTGYFVYRLNQAAYGTGERLPLGDFLFDTQEMGRGVVVGQTGWEQQLEANEQALVAAFVARPAFIAQYPTTLTAAEFVAALNDHTGGSLTPAERADLAARLASGAWTRAQVLRAVAENAAFTRRELNRAFVLMQYFGYLRREPDAEGFQFWLRKLDEFHGDYARAEMVKAFITSAEYRGRFGA